MRFNYSSRLCLIVGRHARKQNIVSLYSKQNPISCFHWNYSLIELFRHSNIFSSSLWCNLYTSIWLSLLMLEGRSFNTQRKNIWIFRHQNWTNRFGNFWFNILLGIVSPCLSIHRRLAVLLWYWWSSWSWSVRLRSRSWFTGCILTSSLSFALKEPTVQSNRVMWYQKKMVRLWNKHICIYMFIGY